MKRKSPQVKKKKTKGAKVPAITAVALAPFAIPDDSPDVLADPRKGLFLQMYFDRESPTFGNAKQSAISAGFSPEYAHSITSLKPKWLYEIICQQDFVQLAETHLKEVLLLPNVTQAMGAFGPIFRTETIKVLKKYKNGKSRLINQKVKSPVMVANTGVIKEKTAAAKVVLPAHDPKYKSKDGPKNAFFFNLAGERARYGGENQNDRVSQSH